MDDAIAGGLLGIAGTLLGVIAAHVVSFSRDERLRRNQFQDAVEAVAIDLDRACRGFRESIHYVPTLGSLAILVAQGHIRQMPPEFAADLLNAAADIDRVNQQNQTLKDFFGAFIASGMKPGHSNNEATEAVRQLVNELLDRLPELTARIRAYRDA